MAVAAMRERVGAAGEAAAIAHLRAEGMRILECDWRSWAGQVDIVAEDRDALVLVEVKARRGTAFGLPQEAVDRRKRHKLRQLMEAYLSDSPCRRSRPYRIDVVALVLDSRLEVVRCEHIRDAVQGA